MFKPAPYSPGFLNGWTWHHDGAKNSVKEFRIRPKEAGKDVSISIDAIRLIGLQYERDFGIIYIDPDITPVNHFQEKQTIKVALACNTFFTSQSLQFSYAVPQVSEVTISILDTRGRCVAVPVHDMHTPGRYTRTLNANTPGLAGGVYVLVMQTGLRNGNSRQVCRKFQFVR